MFLFLGVESPPHVSTSAWWMLSAGWGGGHIALRAHHNGPHVCRDSSALTTSWHASKENCFLGKPSPPLFFFFSYESYFLFDCLTVRLVPCRVRAWFALQPSRFCYLSLCGSHCIPCASADQRVSLHKKLDQQKSSLSRKNVFSVSWTSSLDSGDHRRVWRGQGHPLGHLIAFAVMWDLCFVSGCALLSLSRGSFLAQLSWGMLPAVPAGGTTLPKLPSVGFPLIANLMLFP